ncbi:hypothetical protein FDECE_159, partial [Fusarium decemcellulare]
AGRFEYLTTYYQELESDFLLELGRDMTSEMYSELEHRFPRFAPMLRMVIAQEEFRGGHADYFKQNVISYDRSPLFDRCRTPWSDFRETPSMVRQAVTYSLQLLRRKYETEFAGLISDALPHWEPRCGIHEFDDLRFEPWAIPSRSTLAKVGDRLQDQLALRSILEWRREEWRSPLPVYRARKQRYEQVHPKRRHKFRFSAAAVAIRFLDSLPVKKRLQIRKIILNEDRVSVGRPECHAQGLILFCKENLQLRVEHRVSLWGNILQRDVIPYFEDVPLLEAGVKDNSHRFYIYNAHEAIGGWLAEALAVMEAGMPPGSFSFVLDGEPLADISSDVFQRGIHLAVAWELAFREVAAQGTLWPISDGYICYQAGIDFPQNVARLLNQTSVFRCNFNPGRLWDVETLVEERREWHIGNWIQARSQWRDYIDLPPALINWPELLLDNFEIDPQHGSPKPGNINKRSRGRAGGGRRREGRPGRRI